MTRRDGPRVLGTCYVCGKLVYGTHAKTTTTIYRWTKGGAYRDCNGIRHGGCVQVSPRTVTLSDG